MRIVIFRLRSFAARSDGPRRELLGIRVAPFLASVSEGLVFGYLGRGSGIGCSDACVDSGNWGFECLCRFRELVFECLCRLRDLVLSRVWD